MIFLFSLRGRLLKNDKRFTRIEKYFFFEAFIRFVVLCDLDSFKKLCPLSHSLNDAKTVVWIYFDNSKIWTDDCFYCKQHVSYWSRWQFENKLKQNFKFIQMIFNRPLGVTYSTLLISTFYYETSFRQRSCHHQTTIEKFFVKVLYLNLFLWEPKIEHSGPSCFDFFR